MTKKANQELESRADRLADALKILQDKMELIKEEGEIAPPGCCILRYQAKGKAQTYWYYKLQATEKIFPTKTGGLSKYKHLGVAGSPAHVEAVMQMSRRTQLDALARSFDSLMDSWSDVYGSNKKEPDPVSR
ncbi:MULTISPECIES: hypothetical protein [Crocosphaera]|uniref:Uncharacterized protein n=3 Tax=Crocosphaera watsonii TaxID=263511 RepID=G5JE99_CROWT|nr:MULTISPECIES: hypothetical protein [Crocosphaera]EHJ09487.1 hypothetical protein CWATWH0003_B086 [Crocosphaera watsonii WH 0003]MCJ8282878.1 hypothetical protein [Rivularia sp. ALOHA_DT_140]NQZ64607.1 hypothetical protein [Crocosphaera sp.]CCQ55936.1 hypothetical protein CWATWH0005_5475 [Crocosphaera watsonii WH 0005]